MAVECVYRSTHNAQAADNIEKGRSLEARERHLEDQTRLMELLRSLPGPEAIHLLQRLRSTSDMSRLMSSFEGGLHTETRPSDLETARAILPATQSSVEFELMAQWGTAYPRLYETPIPELLNILPTTKALSSSVLPSFPDGSMVPMRTAKLESHPEPPKQSNSAEAGFGGTKQAMPTTGPRMPRKYRDSRLERLQIGYWTKVPISNELAATLISFYLETEHNIVGFFDADLFVDDLVSCQPNFCSAFLVTAVLCLASQKYTAIKLQTSVLKAALFQEAEMLWNGEAANDSILTVAAIEVFSNACVYEGKDALGMELAMTGRRIAERMGLFGSAEDATAADLARKSPEWARAVAHIAWGAYVWLTFLVVFYHHPPIRYPPSLSIPGQSRDERKQPLTSSQGASYTRSKVFVKYCKLMTIIQEIMSVYIPAGTMTGDGSVSDCVPLGFAEAKYRRLLDWAASLPADMKRVAMASSDLVVFHIMFHFVVITIFRPFTSTPSTERLMSFTSIDSHPKKIHAASVKQLRDLVVNYRTHHLAGSITGFINPGLFTLSLALLEDRSDPLWRFYFVLCVRCWRDLYACYPVFRNVAQAFLSMAMQKDAFTASEAKELMEYIDDNGRHHAGGAEAFTTFIFDPSAGAVGKLQIDAMARKFDEMVLFDEFTTGAMA
ncbi:Nitrogen assimilation transcription factor nit-4 [Colletotrichum sidae]|uniref:Nitrogen assimilation transcription factor nit-4 n=1 Tax=Colletotrichum sidae TaxID=1347389 RepID=A0A4R8TB33_9PEZI|nr:Nitrogen assimilation transcription factor nit-4 [Colletotrichum sidae]